MNRREVVEAVTKDLRPTVVPPPTNPMGVARAFVHEHYTTAGDTKILHHRGDFYTWDGTCWPEAEARTVRAHLYRWLESAVYVTKKGEEVPFEPNRRKLGDVLEAVAAVGHLPQRIGAPAWLDDENHPPATELIVMKNGILHLPTRQLLPHSPHLLVHHGLPFDYDPEAPIPAIWERFLDELWADDIEVIDGLAEMFGYVLVGDTRQQKLFLLVGPRRSGKGTIARVLTGILGGHNVTAPTLSGLTTNFGLQDLIGKPLAVVSDMRLGSRTNGLVAVERLLSISGEDSITVDRKYREPWTGRLPTRFLILSNEIPRFTDSSGALASRFIMLTTTKSFYDGENPGLTDELLAEAPGIFNWALRGLDRLTVRGYFLRPSSSKAAIQQLEDLSSPVGAFVRDRCDAGPSSEVDKDDLFAAWRLWCLSEGMERPGTKAVFSRNLRAVVPGIRDVRPREEDGRRRLYQGIGVRQQWETPRTTLDHRDQEPARSRVAEPNNLRSDAPVQGGPGSSALWSEPVSTMVERVRKEEGR